MQPSILIVDDEPSIVKSLTGLLSDEGFNTLSAFNGYEALKLIEQQKLSSAVSAPARIAPTPAAAPQTNTRFFTPQKRSIRRPGFTEGELSEQNQENIPVEEELPQYEEPEANEGEGPEGEINGKNQ